jgi:transposase-like protein
MDWPTTALESLPPEQFIPPHCPWAECIDHRERPARRFRCHRHGVFVRKGDGRAVPRFLCLTCQRTFSLQTFACSYYLKRPDLSVPIAAGLHAGSAHRQMARSLGCAPSSVTRRAARLGRHALLLSAHALEHLELDEPAVFDHFESFEFSQDFPVGIGTAVGQRSWFVYDLQAAPHRRGGRLSPSQRARLRARRESRPRGAYRRSLRHTLDVLLELAPESSTIRLVTDDHPAYRTELGSHPGRRRFRHDRFQNPPRGPKGSPRSAEAVRRDQEMFAADLLHGLVRHTCAHHRRETIAFGRRINALMERAFLLMVWRNFVKRRSERNTRAPTPAMELGVASEPWSWPRVLAKRLFWSRLRVPKSWRAVYRREWTTAVVGKNQRHRLANAF